MIKNNKEDTLISLLNKVRNIKINKIDHIQWSKPTFRSKKNQVFEIEKPEYVNFDKLLTENDYIIDKNLLSITPSSSYIYTSFDIFQFIYSSSINVKKLTVGSLGAEFAYKKCDYFSDCTNVHLDKLYLDKENNYDFVVVYDMYPLVVDKYLQDTYIEQLRLERNIEKLVVLDKLKNSGDFLYLISHLTIPASKEIVAILSYLFEECILIKPIFHDIISTSFYVYCKNFDKKKFNSIRKKLTVEYYSSSGDIKKLYSLGLVYDDSVFKQLDAFSKNLNVLQNFVVSSKFSTNEIVKFLPKLAFSINIPIYPEYLDSKYKKFNDLYELCVKNNLTFIFSNTKDSTINDVLNIYVKNRKYGFIDTSPEPYMKYELLVVDDISDSDFNNLITQGFIYISNVDSKEIRKYKGSKDEVSGTVSSKIITQLSPNIYKKIGHIIDESYKVLKIKDYNVIIFDNKVYFDNVIEKMFPIIENHDYPIYSIDLNGKIMLDTFDFYPFFPVFTNNKFYVNPIHLKIINNGPSILGSIKEHIKLMLTSEDVSKFLVNTYTDKEDFVKIKVSDEEVPYKSNNHGWLSNGTKSSIYAVSKIFNPESIVEFGTWYGNSAEYIKDLNPDASLSCFDVFRTMFESDYTLKGYGVDKFSLLYPRLESVYKRMQSYKNVELYKGDAYNSLNYLKSNNILPEVIFIDFIKSSKLLFNFLTKIATLFPETIIIGDDYIMDTVKDGVNRFNKTLNNKYQYIKNENSYILIPVNKYNKDVEDLMIKKLNIENSHMIKNKYYICFLLIQKLKFKEAINYINVNNLNLNYKSKYLPNDGTLYHMFGYYLSDVPDKDKYLKLLFKLEEPKNIKNNYEFTFVEMLKFDSSRLFSG